MTNEERFAALEKTVQEKARAIASLSSEISGMQSEIELLAASKASVDQFDGLVAQLEAIARPKLRTSAGYSSISIGPGKSPC